MTLCPRCRSENRDDRRFCSKCAAPLAIVCASCGFSNDPGDEFCGGCAQPLRAVTVAPLKFQSPETYTPRHLAEKILTSKAALEGERKQVTVLFADLKGSMELLADRDPEEARKLLDPVLEHMMEAVHRYEGTVNQVMGDGIMALFGAPLAHEDHAVRACYAALRMQDAIRRYANELRRSHGVTVRIRVGLNSGEVVVRAIGNDLHVDYTAVGQSTHLAARMEQLADPGSTLLTSATAELAEGFVEVNPLGPTPVRGMTEPVEVYELTGAGTARSRLQAAALRGLTKFVGRAAEVAQLGEALDRARAGHGQLAAVVGEAGLGKSRLFWEFTRSHRTDGCRIVEAGSVSYGKATAYLPVIDLLRAYFEIETRDDGRKILEKVTGKLLSLDRALEPSLPALLALLDVPLEDAEWARLDPPQRRQRTLDAVKRVLLRESHVQPLVVVFEDLHWIDGETQALLDSLIESLPTTRLLLLVNYRPEYQHARGGKTYYRQQRIVPLPPESAEELLAALLGSDAALRSLKGVLVKRTEGNPFFLEESVRALVETGVLAGERGAYRVGKPLESIQVPASVQTVLAARIDRLPPADKHLLQCAAVVGKDVPLALLREIAELPDTQLHRGLGQLQAAEFLYETSLFPDLEYTFKHALTHEVAYQGLLHERRRALHARITDAIETISVERVAEQAERLAHHALRGELWEKAVGYLHQAGLRAIARSANREAVAHLEQALETLRRLPESRENTEMAIDLRFELRTAFLPLADLASMERHLREAEALARALGDQRRLGLALGGLVMPRVNTGDWDEAQRSGREALAIAEALGNRPMEMRTTYLLCMVHDVRGEFSQAAALLERIVPLLEGDLLYERFGDASILSVGSRVYLCDVLSQLGRFDEAIAHAEVAVRIAEAADHHFSLCFILLDLGFSQLGRGDVPRATRVLERCLDRCRTWQIAVLTPFAAAALGAAYAFADRLDEALSLVERAVEEFRGRTLYRRPGLVFLFAGMTYLRAGRIGEASALSREALELTRRLGARGNEAHALCLSGDIASTAGAEDAEGYYRSGLALANDLGMRPLVARCRLGLGRLRRRAGRAQEAHEHLATAAAMFREMDMTYWLEQAEAERRELA
jgi:class 3 adenylate cyclase/tetratricopeptide (TPR) repeat protein